MRVEEPKQPVKHRGWLRYSTESSHIPATPITGSNTSGSTTSSSVVEKPWQDVKHVPEKKEQPVTRKRNRKLPHGQRRRDVADALRVLKAEGRRVITGQDVYLALSHDKREQWRKAFGSVGKAQSAATSTMWSMCNGHANPPEGVLLTTTTVLGRYEIKQPNTEVKPHVSVGPESKVNGIQHLTVVGEDVDGNILYLDPTNNLIGTVRFFPIGSAR
jgi:hypothetical protein